MLLPRTCVCACAGTIPVQYSSLTSLDVLVISGSEGLTVSGGWRVSRWLGVLGEVAVERYFEERSAPVIGRRGPYVMCGVRLQVELPQ